MLFLFLNISYIILASYIIMGSFVTSVSISCIILHMAKMFNIKIRKISFYHNARVKVNNPHPTPYPANVILVLSVAT